MVDTVKMLCDRQDFVHILICVGGCVYRCLGEFGTCICRGVHAHVCIYMHVEASGQCLVLFHKKIFKTLFLQPNLSVEPEAFSLPLAGQPASYRGFSTFSTHLGLKATVSFFPCAVSNLGPHACSARLSYLLGPSASRFKPSSNKMSSMISVSSGRNASSGNHSFQQNFSYH